MLHGPKPTQKRARQLRREMTLPEVLLLKELRKRPHGLKFRNQRPAAWQSKSMARRMREAIGQSGTQFVTPG